MLRANLRSRWISARYTLVVMLMYLKYIQNELKLRKNELFKNFAQ